MYFVNFIQRHKMMKKLHSILIFMLLIGTGSCDTNDTPDLCDSIECGDYGNCVDGECECENGYFLDPNSGVCISPCDTVETCPENASCDIYFGSCICNYCFEDDGNGNCVPWNQKFLGTWEGVNISYSNGIHDTSDLYQITIVPYDNPFTNDTTEVEILNYMNLTCPSTGQPLNVKGNCYENDLNVQSTPCQDWTVDGDAWDLGVIANDTLTIIPSLFGPIHVVWIGKYVRQ